MSTPPVNPLYPEVLQADSMKGDAVRSTPLIHSSVLSRMVQSDVYLKTEFHQKTGSFKIRGAYYKIKSMSDEEKQHGVVAASAGNHAQGVAFASSLEDIPCTIVMPKNASPAKVAATKSYGANVILDGTNYEESFARAEKISRETGAAIIHAFDDPYIIAAQGVIGLEILRDLPDVDEIYLPVGGGGLAAGVLVAVKEKNPNVRVVGVQTRAFPSMYQSVKNGSLTPHQDSRTIADGIAVKVPGKLTFSVINDLIDEMVLVDDADIISTMFLLLERAKFVVEPAGAASLAYLLTKKPSPGKKVVAVLAGGNVDMYLLGQVVYKGLAANGRLLKISVILPDRPRAFKDIVDEIAAANVNIVEVLHDRLSSNIGVGSAGVILSLETQGMEQTDALIKRLRDKGVQFSILS